MGEGSIFSFNIPFNITNPEIKTVDGSDRKNKLVLQKQVTILITEDVDNNYLLLEQYFSGANIDVVRAANGSEAVEICEKNQSIGLVLMDLKMPVMDGFEATKRIKKLRPDLTVVAQTAYARDNDREKALECGCSDFISKPYKKETLLSLIRKYLVMD